MSDFGVSEIDISCDEGEAAKDEVHVGEPGPETSWRPFG